METLSESMCFIHKPSQNIILAPDEFSSYRITPPTKREKIINILRIIGYVFLGILLLGLIALATWGVIQYPYLIIFLPLGFLFGALTR